MSKRGNGEGSITQLSDGRYQARVTLQDGRRKAFYGQTRQDVARRLNDALKARQDGLPVVAERQSVAQYLQTWLDTIRPTVRPKTWRRYEEFVRLHAIPEVGKLPIAKLSPQHLQGLYAQCLEKGLSETSVAHLHAVMHRALGQAAKWGVAVRNVASLVDPPRMRRQEMKTLSPQQARRLLDIAKGDRLEALYVLALTTGMRQGEILGLRWKDADLDSAALQVVATLQQVDGAFVFSEPKTARSRRQVALTAAAVAALRRHRARQAEERLRLGPAWEDNGVVFANERGKPIDASNLRRRSFWPLLKRAGLSPIRFHDLRHSAATLMLAGNVHPKVVSEMLGHSQIAVTMDLYSHVTPTMQRQATGVMDALLQA